MYITLPPRAYARGICAQRNQYQIILAFSYGTRRILADDGFNIHFQPMSNKKRLVGFLGAVIFIVSLSGCRITLPIFGQVWFPNLIPGLGKKQKKTRVTKAKQPTSQKQTAAKTPDSVEGKVKAAAKDKAGAKPSPPPTPPPPTELICYVTLTDNHLTIWTMSPEVKLTDEVKPTDEHLQLTRESYDSWLPIFSPDGKNIAYLSDANGKANLWVMDRAGRSKVRLTDLDQMTVSKQPNYERIISWSSDSKYLSLVNDGLLWVIPADGFNPQTVDLPVFGERVVSAAWSKKGSILAYFLSKGDKNLGLWLVEPEYKNTTQHLASKLRYPIIEWSHSKDILAYFLNGIVLLYINQKDIQILEMDDANIYLKWNPSSDKKASDQIAYVKANKKGGRDIWLIDNLTDEGVGTRKERLLVKNADFPCWSPDGKNIAYVSTEDIWMIGTDGKRGKRLTISGGWSPDWGKLVNIKGDKK